MARGDWTKGSDIIDQLRRENVSNVNYPKDSANVRMRPTPQPGRAATQIVQPTTEQLAEQRGGAYPLGRITVLPSDGFHIAHVVRAR